MNGKAEYSSLAATESVPNGEFDTEAFNIGEHARLSFEEISQTGEPRQPLPEEGASELHRGKRNVKVKVIPASGSEVRNEVVYLKRLDNNCDFVYRRLKEKKSVDVNHGGTLIYALKMERVEGVTNLYREPALQDREKHTVAIKKQNLAKIQHALDRGHHENPFIAIKRMQQIGDNIHVLRCIEALRDEKNLYTIMPACSGTIMSSADGSEIMARRCILKVWKNIHYLQRHGIVHHDISPDNIMWFDGNLVLIDLAMSLQVPHEPERRSLLLPQGRYGKPPYMSPEVYASRGPFDGYALDVWSSACILYNMLTNGFWLFRCPYPTDTLFRYFIMAKGLSNDPLNARTIEILMDVFQRGNDVTDRQDLLSRAMAHVQFTPTCTKLLSRMFQLRPEDRYSLAECIESSWAKGEENLRGNSLRSRDQ